MNQFFGITGMPTVPSSYWNDVHGYTGEDVYKDEEGLQTVQNLARNMAFMIKAIKAEKEANGKPEMKHDCWTHFIRE
jgi:multimeric flavodoxin WrbA